MVPLLCGGTVEGVFVGLAGAILIGAAMLQRSLGDVVGDEAELPSAAGAKTVRCLLLLRCCKFILNVLLF